MTHPYKFISRGTSIATVHLLYLYERVKFRSALKKIAAFLQIIFVVVLEAINSLKEYLNASQITRTIYA